MRNIGIFLCSALAGGALMVTSFDAPAQPRRELPGGRAEGCTVYWDADYQGRREFAPDGDSAAFVGPAWNDQISSLRCDPRCVLEAFEDADYQGGREIYRGDVAFVGPAWNDRISAYRVTCGRGGGRYGGRRRAPACTFYEHADYAGRREEAGEGAVRYVGDVWNDQISSIQCRPGCAALVFVDADYAGPSRRFDGDVGFVGPFWNDKISAYRVTCLR